MSLNDLELLALNDKLRRPQLFEWHKTHGDIVPFAGWEMPVRYTDIRKEHLAVRNAVGIFDTSHMYRFFIRGPQAAQFLQTVTTNNVNKLKVSGGHYTTCLNEQGGIHDDLMLYRIAEHEYIWITNASNGPKITQHLLTEAANFEVEVDESTTFKFDENSSYIRNPPFFKDFSLDLPDLEDIKDARALLVLGDSVTTDHISPAGAIPVDYPAGKYLIEKGVKPLDFNSYGSRRGNHEVMMRGTFANIRIKKRKQQILHTRHFESTL